MSWWITVMRDRYTSLAFMVKKNINNPVVFFLLLNGSKYINNKNASIYFFEFQSKVMGLHFYIDQIQNS